MTDKKDQRIKIQTLLSTVIFSVIMMIFPVASGVIVVIYNIDTLQSHYVQGVFMMLSISVPIIYMLFSKIRPSQVGFSRIERNSLKTVLYFIPVIAVKIAFLFFGINNDLETIVALLFFTIAIGLSEELYFRGIILNKLRSCFTIKQTIILSSVFFAAVHASQAFSGATIIIVVLTVINAFLFGIVAAEIVILTKSIVPVIIWHTLYDFINWVSLTKGTTEAVLIVVQTIIMIVYAYYLWTKVRSEDDKRQNETVNTPYIAS